MRIRALFDDARTEGKKLFIPYITCGDPTLDITRDIVKELTAIGADIIELGVPFSDPVADGVTNQRSSMRSLKNNVSIKNCCETVKKLRDEGCNTPVILFTYFNPIFKLGIHCFSEFAKNCGIDAVLIVDLPVEESHEITEILNKHNLGIVLLIAPTTTPERISLTNKQNPEFLYYISRTGVTGTQDELSSTLAQELKDMKQYTTLPIAVGFGISTPAQAAMVAKSSDAVIVGSVLVKELEKDYFTEGKMKLLKIASDLNAAIKGNPI